MSGLQGYGLLPNSLNKPKAATALPATTIPGSPTDVVDSSTPTSTQATTPSSVLNQIVGGAPTTSSAPATASATGGGGKGTTPAIGGGGGGGGGGVLPWLNSDAGVTPQPGTPEAA